METDLIRQVWSGLRRTHGHRNTWRGHDTPSLCMARLVSLARSPAASAAEEGSCVWSAIALANDMAIRAGRALGMQVHPPRGGELTLREAT